MKDKFTYKWFIKSVWKKWATFSNFSDKRRHDSAKLLEMKVFRPHSSDNDEAKLKLSLEDITYFTKSKLKSLVFKMEGEGDPVFISIKKSVVENNSTILQIQDISDSILQAEL